MKHSGMKELAICAALICSIMLISGCKKDEKAELKAPPRQVRSIQLLGGDGAFRQNFSGQLHASSEVSISFKVSGTIETIPVKVGDRVRKGDRLATLDDSDYQLAVQQARAALKESQERARNAKADYERAKKLFAAGNTSRNELDSARAASGSANAAAQVSGKSLEIAQKNLSYTILKAEDSCGIASIDVDVGENITAGTQVFFATCGNELEVKLNIPESSIGYIKKGMPVRVTFSAIGDKTYSGIVNEVGVSSVKGGITFPVDVLITDPDQIGLKAGLSADVAFEIQAEKSVDSANAIVVPPFAVGEDEAGRFVFVLEPSTQDTASIRRQSVKLGNTTQSGIEVIEGLNPGMRVVTAGISVLRNGMEVTYSDE